MVICVGFFPVVFGIPVPDGTVCLPGVMKHRGVSRLEPLILGVGLRDACLLSGIALPFFVLL